jgi:hypothetical protein
MSIFKRVLPFALSVPAILFPALEIGGSGDRRPHITSHNGPNVTFGIEIKLPAGGMWPVAVGADAAIFYIPVVARGEVAGVIAVPNERLAGIRIIPSMQQESVRIAVSALVPGKKKLSEATCDEIRAWQSVDAGFYEGKRDESLMLKGLGPLGFPIFHVKVVAATGPPPGGFRHPYVDSRAYCACSSTRDALNESIDLLAYPDAGKCVQIGECAQCCRISPP